jgi:hypothetical protein
MKTLRRQVFALRVALAGIVSLGLAVAPLAEASAQGPSDPAKLKAASESFEAGAKAFKDGRYEEAAAHFESADEAVPSAKALRLAMRSRREAKQTSRAATLAALALERYPDDPETKTFASDVALELSGKLHRLDISCVSPCVLSSTGADGRSRVAHGTPNTRWTLYVEPGYPTVAASFVVGDLQAPEQKVAAKAGGSSTLRFVPEGGASGPTTGPSQPTTKTSPEPGGRGEGTPPTPTSSGADDDDATEDDATASVDSASSGSGLSPVFFFVGLAATAGLGGVTVWSGIDTQNNPGPDAVREACAGLGTDCPAYQDGQAKELRTNVLIGATAGAAVLTTAVGLFLTDWGGSSTPSADAARTRVWVDVIGGPASPQAGPASTGEARLSGFVANIAGRF